MANQNQPKRIGRCKQCGVGLCEGTEHEQVCRFNFEPNLRDQFAMAALPLVAQICIAAACVADRKILTPESMSNDAYILADAMLEARKK